ncbi:LysE family translocator [Acinetobacter schindleri]|uniref:LysE family translocator n=1 Tax=Acinetobacter schindleri TaxID=108981 RepID=UPI003342C7CC
MSSNTLLAFWSVSILFVITPGVDWAYAISAGIQGRRVVPAVTGLLSGHFIATLIVAAGVGTLIAGYPALLLILTTIGALYLLWIGFNLFTHPASITSNSVENIDSTSAKSWFIKGICISGLNPKLFLLFLALLPPFIDANSSLSATTQIILLGTIHIISCAIVYFFVGFSAQKVLKARPRAAQIVSRISGALMILIAIILILEQFSLS